MPTSTRKKKRGSKKAKRKIVGTETASLRRPIRIRRHKFAHLKNNNDFLALVKVGRLVNAVAFGLQCTSDYMDDESPVGRRQYIRAFFMTGGYLFEGMRLIESLRLKYILEPHFQKLHDLIGDEYKQQYKVLHKMRDAVAFHLDSDDKSTKAAIANLKLPRYDLMSGESARVMDFYFNFADTVDLNYLIDEFKGNKTEQETVLLIFGTVSEFMSKFIIAGHEFLTGQGTKMKFWEYTD